MIKVIYRMLVNCEGNEYIVEKEGTLLSVPKKDEIVDINVGMSFKIANIHHKDNKGYVEIHFYSISVIKEQYLLLKESGFEELS